MRLTYGYTIDENGNDALNEYEVGVIHKIYDSYLSISKLYKMLAANNISSLSGKETWSNAAPTEWSMGAGYVSLVLSSLRKRQSSSSATP